MDFDLILKTNSKDEDAQTYTLPFLTQFDIILNGFRYHSKN
jgi:hypothetical protein